MLGDALKQRLMHLHRLLAPKEADPYQPDIERWALLFFFSFPTSSTTIVYEYALMLNLNSYLALFVDRFWPELSPLQWDLSGDPDLVNVSEQEMNSYALVLCCSLFCGT